MLLLPSRCRRVDNLLSKRRIPVQSSRFDCTSSPLPCFDFDLISRRFHRCGVASRIISCQNIGYRFSRAGLYCTLSSVAPAKEDPAHLPCLSCAASAGIIASNNNNLFFCIFAVLRCDKPEMIKAPGKNSDFFQNNTCNIRER